MTEPHVLLLRGVNVGGRNRLAMRDLVAVVEAAGGRGARTYIQSGNVVCALDPAAAADVAREVEAAITARHGVRSPVVVRSRSSWEEVLRAEAFPGADEATLHVAFLAEAPAAERAARLDPDRSPGDRFVLRGREVFLHLPNGVAGTRLTNDWLDRALGTVSTVRNWRTVRAIAALAASLA